MLFDSEDNQAVTLFYRAGGVKVKWHCNMLIEVQLCLLFEMEFRRKRGGKPLTCIIENIRISIGLF